MGKLSMGVFCFIFVLLASLPCATSSATGISDFSKTKAIARTEIWKAISGGASSASVAVMDNGVVVYSEGFGMADRVQGIPVDENTIFNISSLSKMPCTTAVMLLVDDGKVSLDKPVTAYIPEFTMADERYKNITVRMLLNHTSGLPGTVPYGVEGTTYNKEFAKDFLAVLSKSHLKHNPGEMAPYCNDGFTLAEILVAKVSGKSYIDFLRERVFKPLGLQNTGIGVGVRQLEKGVTAAKVYTSDGMSETLEVISSLGGGGLSSTAVDLCKFGDSFTTGGTHILSAAALAEMSKRQPTEYNGKLRHPDSGNGLGWDYTEVPRFKEQGIKVIGKGGDTHYHSMLFILPEKRITVAVIAAGPTAAPKIAADVLETYLAEKGNYVKEPAQVKRPLEAQPVPQELSVYDGYYASIDTLLHVKIDQSANTLFVSSVKGDQEKQLVSAVYSGGYFQANGDRMYFATVDDKPFLVYYLKDYGFDSVVCQKLPLEAEPKTLKVAVDGKQWLRRNAKVSETGITYVVTSKLIKVLPGYIDFQGPKKVISPEAAVPAVNYVRDLTELALLDKGSATWIWLSGLLYSPAEDAKVLAGSEAVVTIGTEGYNEWLSLKENAVLSFETPVKGRVVVIDGSGSVLYDNLTNSGAVYAPSGSYIQMAAEPGAVFKVTMVD